MCEVRRLEQEGVGEGKADLVRQGGRVMSHDGGDHFCFHLCSTQTVPTEICLRSCRQHVAQQSWASDIYIQRMTSALDFNKWYSGLSNQQIKCIMAGSNFSFPYDVRSRFVRAPIFDCRCSLGLDLHSQPLTFHRLFSNFEL